MSRFSGSTKVLIFVSLLFVLLLSACTGNTEDNNSSTAKNGGTPEADVSTKGESTKEEAETPIPIEIAMATGKTAIPSPDQNIIKQSLDKALNTDFQITGYADTNDLMTQLNVRIASSNFPDIMLIPDMNDANQYAEMGVLLDLTPYLDHLKDFRSYVGEQVFSTGNTAGKQYFLPRPNIANQYSLWIRQDWLDQLNLKAPTTLEEFYNVAKAFTEQDPDGNGQDDTYGLTGNGIIGSNTTFAPVFSAYGINSVDSIQIKDGKMVSSLYDPATKEVLTYINRFITEKIVDPEFISNKGSTVRDKLFQGQYGMVYFNWPNIMKSEFKEVWSSLNPNANWVQVGPLEGPAGKFFPGSNSINSGVLALPKSLEETPEKLLKVLELINYTATPEGSVLTSYGIDGVHYEKDGDTIKPLPKLDEEGGYFYVYQLAGRPEMLYLRTKFPDQWEYIEFAHEQPRLVPYNGYVTYPAEMNKADVDRFIEEQITKFAYGNTSIDQYDQFLSTLESTYKYKDMMNFAEEQLRTLGKIE